MTEAEDGTPAGDRDAVTPPSVGFGFNLGKIPDQGEDSDPILRAGRDLALLAVFDGMGGAGGTVYETPEGPRTGAYLASRRARDVVEERMLELLRPDRLFDVRRAAEELRSVVRAALVARLEELQAPKSGLRSRLLRALPTTMALVALQRSPADADRWVGYVMWAGDSRAYVFDPDGARQLTSDDLRDPGDAMENLRHDSVVSNAMSADTDFEVHHRTVELRAPCFVVCATDGCYGYVPSPMHFEHLVLSELERADDVTEWSERLQREITAVTGDDAAMATLGLGGDFAELKTAFAGRVEELATRYLEPLDRATEAVHAAEAALGAARRDHEATVNDRWQEYKPGYEEHLRAADAGGAACGGQQPDGSELRDLLQRAPAAHAAENGEDQHGNERL